MKDTDIKLSFTSLALGLREADAVVELWNKLHDWSAVREEVIRQNLFQKSSETSTTRIFRELRPRLEKLSEETLLTYSSLNSQDKSVVLLIACASCYPFIREFINTTISDKVLVFDYSLTHADYNVFWDRMELTHPEMEKISDTTKKKVRQVLWRILAEASLLSSTKNPQITPIIASNEVRKILEKEAAQINPAFMN